MRRTDALVLLVTSSFAAASSPSNFSGRFISGSSTSPEGAKFLLLLDQARRMFAPSDPELMTLSGNYDPVAMGLTEGAQWKGNFW